ncbi:hypothetical protein ACFFKH_09620 [Micromonospora marina]|uniref:Uncharacterized protein n=1 Tax=Micromonospora marina TaxID=307120 RepID=A0A1C4XBH4_9ACTN|nr:MULTISPECIES: hypothetical protein [Micromonospora]SCF05694.1 hypothetical protein GA0070215_10725 [Micromonospora marina]
MSDLRYGYEPDPLDPSQRAQTFSAVDNEYEMEATDRHYSLPVNPYSQPAYGYPSSSTDVAPPQFTDSFNDGRRVSPPVPTRSSRQSSAAARHSAAASHQVDRLRRRSTFVASDPDRLVQTAMQVGAVTTPEPVEPRRSSQVRPANPNRPTESEARRGAQNAGFKGLTDFKNCMNRYLPPGTEFTASSLSAISGVLEGWAARGTQIGAASVTALKSGVEFIDAAQKGDWTKAAVHAGNLTGMGLSIAGTATNITHLTAAGGMVAAGSAFTNAAVDQRRTAIQQQSQNVDLERGRTSPRSSTAPAAGPAQQAPARGR